MRFDQHESRKFGAWPLHGRVRRAAVLAGAACLLVSGPLPAQYRVVSPAGDTITVETEAVREMLDSTRALRLDIEVDPRVLYAIGYGDPVTEENADPAWPWNAIEVRSDSAVELTTPGNLREADRAYANYSVIRMRNVRSRDPDAACDSIVDWEATAVSSFIDGWIVARTLFGGPPFGPLDALAFARLDGHVPALIVDIGDRQIGACAEEWADSHPDAVRAYRSWHDRQFPAPELEETIPLEQTVPPDGEAAPSVEPVASDEPPPAES
jgi:hypothetical protein